MIAESIDYRISRGSNQSVKPPILIANCEASARNATLRRYIDDDVIVTNNRRDIQSVRWLLLVHSDHVRLGSTRLNPIISVMSPRWKYLRLLSFRKEIGQITGSVVCGDSILRAIVISFSCLLRNSHICCLEKELAEWWILHFDGDALYLKYFCYRVLLYFKIKIYSKTLKLATVAIYSYFIKFLLRDIFNYYIFKSTCQNIFALPFIFLIFETLIMFM